MELARLRQPYHAFVGDSRYRGLGDLLVLKIIKALRASKCLIFKATSSNVRYILSWLMRCWHSESPRAGAQMAPEPGVRNKTVL